jgi:hypothetical protein
MTSTKRVSRRSGILCAITELRGEYYIAWKLWGKFTLLLMTGAEGEATRAHSCAW